MLDQNLASFAGTASVTDDQWAGGVIGRTINWAGGGVTVCTYESCLAEGGGGE